MNVASIIEAKELSSTKPITVNQTQVEAGAVEIETLVAHVA